MDRGFILLLFLTSLTGLALLAGRTPTEWAYCWRSIWKRGDGALSPLPTENSPTDFFRCATLTQMGG